MKRRFQLLPVTIFIAIFFLLNWYALSGLQVVATEAYVPSVFWSVISLSVFALIFAIQGIQSRGMGVFFKIATHAFLMLFVSELIFIINLILDDIFRVLAGLFQLIKQGDFLAPARNIYWVEFGIGLFFASILLFLYGIIKGKYAYRVIKHTLTFKDLPSAFDGFTITQISDVHAGSFTNPKAVQKGIDLINEQKSDLFVFTGDLVNNKAEEIKPWIGHFSQIKTKYGQFSILGNHDYGDYVKWDNDLVKRGNLQQLKKYHSELGFHLLLDEHIDLNKDGQKIILAGIENWGLGFGERGDLQKALQGTTPEGFKVLLSHDPSHWDAQVKNNPSKIHLTLAGHTHGMQFGIEAFGIKWSPVKLRYKHWAGIKEENGRFLNVNRGFGFIGFSGRVGIWPEITVIELKKG
ncbi:metallophosphoesterase [Pedobacter frigiditerrae]|uniref:Metallophosphoesterase n=1 Tax=Pedobacter frigiditerrae TaxID=2530452 RepID=A0A4R0N1Q7_9SPHI|nr:metallophosphoesterase [Pedobacter frigiditerrae]TCC93721.1 metallophosphoesterase [Pedobacter frigiditerrae]